MSSQDLDNAIKSINESASRTNTTTDFFNRVLDGGQAESVQNPLTGTVVPSVQKAVYDQYKNDVNQIAQDVADANAAADRAEAAVGKTLSKSSISAAMASGDSVTLAFFGDSTTDGFATTGWTANPTSGGKAVGNTNHNLNSPNAYPTKLEGILRDMFKNDSIRTFNAGYSGKSLADGWALDNYDAAITNNPFYGTPTATFIDFGLNDVRPAGSQINDFRDQLEALIDKIIGYGTIPVILTCDPVMRNFNVTNAIYNREVLLQIDDVKREVAARKRVPLIEKGNILRGWANNNNDGYRWFLEQSTDSNGDGNYNSGDDVGLHFKDVGHSVKAGVIASQLFPATVFYSGGKQRITSNDARADCFGNFLLTLSGNSGANSVQGFNFKVDYMDANPAHRPSGPGAPMTTIWVWNESNDAKLRYRGLVGEGWGTDSPDTAISNPEPPKVYVKNLTSGNEFSKVPPSVGFRYPGFYKPSDMPMETDGIGYGLNKIQYRCGDMSHYNQGSKSLFFYGFFELDESKEISGIAKTLQIANSKSILNVAGFENEIGVLDSERLVILLDASMPIGCGVSLLSSSSFSGIAPGVDDGYGSKQALVLYRSDDTRFRLAISKVSADGLTVISLPVNVAAAVPMVNGSVKARIEISRSFSAGDFGSGNQLIKMFSGWGGDSSSLIQSTSIATPSGIPVNFGGAVGGFYARSDLNTLGGSVVINSISAFKV